MKLPRISSPHPEPPAGISRKAEYLHACQLVWVLARREISAEYKGTVLGRLWSLINPLATIAVFAVIFGVIFRGGVEPGRNSGIDSFALWIGIGVLCWGYLSRVITNGMNTLVGNAGLLTKVYFPRWVLVLASTVAQTFNFLFELLVLLIVTMLMGGSKVLLYVPLLIPILLLSAAFGTGLALLLSVGTVYYRDISHLWGIFTQIWMYASGVVFPLSMLVSAQETLAAKGFNWGGKPLPLDVIFRINPAELILEANRAVFYDYAVAPPEVWLGITIWAVLSLLAGILVFKKASKRIVEEL
ncbi:ABC transporter permease [Mobiluncus mulieris]|uniref:ABC transporter permease n=1 Tax=Mobiluncus mulieris TaxID=2052 RepID=UPI0032119A71